MGGVCGWCFGLVASCAVKKEKLRSWTVAGPGTEQKYVRESPYKGCREIAELRIIHYSPWPQCLNECPYEKVGK